MTGNGNLPVIHVTKHCPEHKTEVFRPSMNLTPPKSKYGFDVIVEIGMLRYIRNEQIDEIGEQLDSKGIHIPERTIEYLCHVFLRYIIAVHLESSPQISKIFEKQGGYVLHADATTTKGFPQLLLVKDSWTDIKLIAAPITSEASQFVKPHLEEIRQRFGNPIAAIRDMGSGIEQAISGTFRGVYVITSHFHFLRAVGKRLLDGMYPGFNRRLNNTGIKKNLRKLRKQFTNRNVSQDRDKALVLLNHILTYKKDGNGVGYPFSVQAIDFYRRCEEVRLKVREAILQRAEDNICSPCLSRLENTLRLLRPPPNVRGRIHSEYFKLLERWKWFEKIRKALRYRNAPVPLNTDGFLSDKELETGRKMIIKLQENIAEFVTHGDSGKDRYLKKILCGISELIEERKDELFVPNVVLTINGEQKIRKLPRTNNAAEHEFRCLRRHGRRIRGDADVERIVQREGVGMIIVKNLMVKCYVRKVYGRLDRMPLRFSEVSMSSLEKAKALLRPK